MMSSFVKIITTIAVITWLLLQNINPVESAEIPPSDCILLIGGEGQRYRKIEKNPIEYYNPDGGECDLTHFPSLNLSKQQIPKYSSGCYFAETQQIVLREDAKHKNTSIYGLQDGSIKDIAAAHSPAACRTTAASFGPTQCLSCGGTATCQNTGYGQQSCYKFDVTANKWTDISPLPISNGIYGAASVSLGGFYYVMGGYEYGHHTPHSNQFHGYNTTQKQWTTMKPMKSKRYAPSAVPLSDDEFMLCGGDDGNYILKSCEVYNIQTKKWQNVGRMNKQRRFFALVNFNGQIYAMGGFEDDGNPATAIQTVEKYNTSTNSWLEVKPLKIKRAAFVAFAVTLRPPPPTTTPPSITLTTADTMLHDKTANYDTPEATTTSGDKFNPLLFAGLVVGILLVEFLLLSACCACSYKIAQRVFRDRGQAEIVVDRRTESQRPDDDTINQEKADEENGRAEHQPQH